MVVERTANSLRYHLYGREFPVDDRRVAIIEDRPSARSFGELGRLLVRGDGGWREAGQGKLGEDERDLLARVADALRLHMLRVLEYRRLVDAADTADERRRGREIRKTLERQTLPERELVAEPHRPDRAPGPPRSRDGTPRLRARHDARRDAGASPARRRAEPRVARRPRRAASIDAAHLFSFDHRSG